MATYGEGEPTDNALSFYKWLKNDEDSDSKRSVLENLKFTVFGLGNKQYEHFNRMGKLTNRILEESGAKRIFEYGEGDDDANMEEDFDKWKSKLWNSLSQQFHTKDTLTQNLEGEESEVISKYKVVTLPAEGYVPHTERPLAATAADHSAAAPSARHFFNSPRARIQTNRELRRSTAASSGSTRHIEISAGEVGVGYQTADNLAVLPENSSSIVEAVARALTVSIDDVFTLEVTRSRHFDDFKFIYNQFTFTIFMNYFSY